MVEAHPSASQEIFSMFTIRNPMIRTPTHPHMMLMLGGRSPRKVYIIWGGNSEFFLFVGFPHVVNSYTLTRFMSGTDQYAQQCFFILFPAEYFFLTSFNALSKTEEIMHKMKLERAYTKAKHIQTYQLSQGTSGAWGPLCVRTC